MLQFLNNGSKWDELILTVSVVRTSHKKLGGGGIFSDGGMTAFELNWGVSIAMRSPSPIPTQQWNTCLFSKFQEIKNALVWWKVDLQQQKHISPADNLN